MTIQKKKKGKLAWHTFFKRQGYLGKMDCGDARMRLGWTRTRHQNQKAQHLQQIQIRNTSTNP